MKIYQQKQAVNSPVWLYPALVIVNLLLFTSESRWVLQTKKSNLEKGRQFTNIFHFIDGLCARNDNSEFEKVFKKFFEPE